MYVYEDFKMKILSKDYDAAKQILTDVEIDPEIFNALSNAAMFLSLAFRYPDDDVYDTLSDNWDAFKDFITDYCDGNPELYDQTEMESDHILLFDQDPKGNKIVPYISYYTEINKTLYGKSTFDIREWMNEEGFALDKDIKELEDHIYVVLEFMSVLFKRLAQPENIEKWYTSLNNLYSLLENYGPVMSDEFAEALSKRDDKPFYSDFGKILKEFLNDIDPILEDTLIGETESDIK